MSEKLKVAVLAGGYSGESVISIKSAATILEHIDRERFTPTLVHIDEKCWWVENAEGNKAGEIEKSNFTWTDSLDQTHSFDIAYIIVHGTPGEDGIIQAYLEDLNIPFTTGSSASVKGTFDKFATTSLLRENGFTVGSSIVVDDASLIGEPLTTKITSQVGYPCFIKPNNGGSSLGISKVGTAADVDTALRLAFDTGCSSVIVESLLEGREFSMGVVPSSTGVPTAMPITEIVTDNEFFDYEAKYEGASDEITPASIPESAKRLMQETGEKAYKLLGCHGMVRIDFILVNDEIPAILEVNTVPGFSSVSILPQQLAHAGIPIKDMLTRVLTLPYQDCL